MEKNNDYELNTISAYWNERSEGFDAEHDTEDLGLWSLELEKEICRSGSAKVLDVGTGTDLVEVSPGHFLLK